MEELSPNRALLSSPGGLRSMASQQDLNTTGKKDEFNAPVATRANYATQQEETTILNG